MYRTCSWRSGTDAEVGNAKTRTSGWTRKINGRIAMA
jgi:hypothetical protein